MQLLAEAEESFRRCEIHGNPQVRAIAHQGSECARIMGINIWDRAEVSARPHEGSSLMELVAYDAADHRSYTAPEVGAYDQAELPKGRSQVLAFWLGFRVALQVSRLSRAVRAASQKRTDLISRFLQK